MKKLLLLFSIFILTLALYSCGEKYDPVPSTEEESRVVMQLEVGTEKFEVKYELYRALFLGCKSLVDGGDESVWSGENKDEYINKINEIICEKASYIYSTLHVAKSVGINPYSVDADNAVKEAIRVSVEGDSEGHSGHGSYEKFLASLASRGLNYSVADLLIRSEWAKAKTETYFAGTEDTVQGLVGGNLDISDEALLRFYNGEECVRVLEAFFPENLMLTQSTVDAFAASLRAKSTAYERAELITSKTISTELDGKGGVIGTCVGKYSLDSYYFSSYIDAAFSMTVDEVSDGILIKGAADEGSNGYYVLAMLNKDEDYFTNHKDLVLNSYIKNEIGKKIYGTKDALAESARLTDKYGEIVHADIAK